MAKAKTSAGAAKTAARKSVTLVATVREAKEVVATGDFTSWSLEGIRLKRRPDGTWTTNLQLRRQYRQTRVGCGRTPGPELRCAFRVGGVGRRVDLSNPRRQSRPQGPTPSCRRIAVRSWNRHARRRRPYRASAALGASLGRLALLSDTRARATARAAIVNEP
jgi:hypothetical protein